MLKVYSNAGMSKQHVGTCENGIVYREEAFGRTEIGSYENGNVYSGIGYMKKRVGGYDDRTIYRNGFFDVAVGEVDSNGDAYNRTDIFKNINGRNISDIGAVAAAQLLFPGCYYEEDASKSADSSANTNDFSAASVLFSILGTLFIAVWKFIKTIPIWGPYGSILLLPFLMTAGSSGNSSSGGSGSVAGVFFFAYLILHTILLFKCKKWAAKHKYWPIYVGSILLVTTLVAMWAVPAVAFQIGVLIYMNQQRKELR